MPQLRDPTTIESRIYGRRRGNGTPRYYGDYRDFSDVGGGQEPLVPEGKRYATTCSDEAAELAEERLEELKNKRKKRPTGPASKRALKVLIPDHLTPKAKLDEGGSSGSATCRCTWRRSRGTPGPTGTLPTSSSGKS